MAEELPLDTVSHRATGPRFGGGRLASRFGKEISLGSVKRSMGAGAPMKRSQPMAISAHLAGVVVVGGGAVVEYLVVTKPA